MSDPKDSPVEGHADTGGGTPVVGAVRRSSPGAGLSRPGGGGGPRRVIGPRGLAIIQKMAAEGHSNAGIAKALRMSGETLAQCRRRQPEVEEALERGRAALEQECAHYLLTKVRTGEPQGLVAAIFLLKARCGWREGDAPESRAGITINLPAAVDSETWLALIRKAGSGSLPAALAEALPPTPEE